MARVNETLLDEVVKIALEDSDPTELLDGVRQRLEARDLAEEAPVFTPVEMRAAVKAVVQAYGGVGTIMGHVRSDREISPESADAIKVIVQAAYDEMRIGQ